MAEQAVLLLLLQTQRQLPAGEGGEAGKRTWLGSCLSCCCIG